MIVADGLTVTYPDGYTALIDAFLTSNEGEVTVLAGPNGGGKTTLLRVLLGIIPHYIKASVKGKVEVDGIDPVRDPQGLRRIIQGTQQDPYAQVVGPTPFLEAGLAPSLWGMPRSEAVERARRALELVGLEGLKNKPVTRLSTGQLVRVGLAGVFSIEPRYLLLDEPTSHLDSEASTRVRSIVLKLKGKGVGLIIATHDTSMWSIADKCYTINRGVREGCPSPPRKTIHRDKNPEGPLILRLEDIWASYPGGEPVLKGVSLEASRGEMIAITGPNGSGKTTLLLVIAGILSPVKGSIRRKEKPVILPPDPLLLFSRGTLRDELAGRDPPTWAKSILDKPLLRASLGEIRLAALALIASSKKQLLLIDEPTVGLDPWNKWSIIEALVDLSEEGYTIIYATHDEDLSQIADRRYRLRDGVAYEY